MKSVLTLGALSLLSACDTEQAPVTCRAASANIPFAVKYTQTSAPVVGCEASPGELMQLSTYAPPGVDKPSLAIGPENALTYDPETEELISTGERFAVGSFDTTSASESNTCAVPTLSNVNLTAAGNTIVYAFSNVETYVSAANQGTQVKGDVTITDGACTTSYKMLGIWPAVDCTLVDEEGEPILDTAGNPQPDESVCQATDTGINPDVVAAGGVTCSPTLFNCVLTGNDFVKTGGDL